MVAKTEIYFATRKTANAHVYITKGEGKVRVNNVPINMIEPEVAREVILFLNSPEISSGVKITSRATSGSTILIGTLFTLTLPSPLVM